MFMRIGGWSYQFSMTHRRLYCMLAEYPLEPTRVVYAQLRVKNNFSLTAAS